MRVLFVTSEVAPLVKTGGLADVSAALPFALRQLGVDVRVLLPGYPAVMEALPGLKWVARFADMPGMPDADLLEGALPDGVPLYVINCPACYDRGGGLYQDERGVDWADNAVRFGLLSKIAAVLACADSPLEWRPDVAHCNDWQAGLAPAYLHFSPKPAPVVMTVHNLAFQGVFPAGATELLGLPLQSYQPEGVEYYGNLSFLKAGLYYAAHITTVSPSYAAEIQTETMGFGMQGLLRTRRKQLSGILNGVDAHDWNPATDRRLAQHFDADSLENKAINKRALQARLGLDSNPDLPLFVLVGRFTQQKGVDLVLEIAPQLADMPAQLALLGTGDAHLQGLAYALLQSYAGRIGGLLGFDEDLSHLFEAGGDIFLMPSRFEPCGLNQMYSQHYGTPPIVNATGGLIDTVVDCNEQTLADGSATGFVIQDELDAAALLAACRRAVALYHDKSTWHKVQQNGMRRDFGWESSAKAYRKIYTRLMKK
jgi:starch synthase